MKVQVDPDFAFETDNFAAIRIRYYGHNPPSECAVEGLPIERLSLPLEYPQNDWVTLKWYDYIEVETARTAVKLFAEAFPPLEEWSDEE